VVISFVGIASHLLGYTNIGIYKLFIVE